MSSRKSWPAVVLLVTTVGFLLRIYRLDAVSLRGDEAFTVQNWMLLPLSKSLTQIASIEPHPFLNYVLFHIWGLLVGATEFGARYLPALLNTLGIPAVYTLGKRLVSRRVGIMASVCWAVHPFLIWHSQDARNYAIWSGLSVVVLWLGVRAVQRNRWLDWILYTLFAAITANIFYFELFTLVSFAVFVLVQYREQRQVVYRLLSAQSFAFLMAGLSFVLLQGNLIGAGGYGGTIGGGLQISHLLFGFLPVLLFGDTLPVSILYSVPLIGVFVWAVVIASRVNRFVFHFASVLSLLPVVLLSLVSLRFDVFAPRYILSAVPGFILLLVIFLDYLLFHVRSYLVLLGVVLIASGLVLSGSSLFSFWFVHDYAKSKDWPSVTDYLETRVTSDDLIIQLSVDPAFGYYYDGAAPDIGLPANPVQPASEIIHELETASERYKSLWLVGQTFPDWPNYGVVEHWLNTYMQPVRQATLAGMSVHQYKQWTVLPDEMALKPQAGFGEIVELVGHQVWLPPEPDALTIWLYWRPLRQTTAQYKVFVHLSGAANTPLWSQDDRYPQNGRISTTDWSLAAIYRDVYSVPLSSVPAGDYTLRVGWYNPDTNERLPLPTGEDSYPLQTVTLP